MELEGHFKTSLEGKVIEEKLWIISFLFHPSQSHLYQDKVESFWHENWMGQFRCWLNALRRPARISSSSHKQKLQPQYLSQKLNKGRQIFQNDAASILGGRLCWIPNQTKSTHSFFFTNSSLIRKAKHRWTVLIEIFVSFLHPKIFYYAFHTHPRTHDDLSSRGSDTNFCLHQIPSALWFKKV